MRKPKYPYQLVFASLACALSGSLPLAFGGVDQAPGGSLQSSLEAHFRPSEAEPAWSFGLSLSPNAFGGRALRPIQGDSPFYALQLSFEYEPPLLRSLGVISLGPTLGIYKVMGEGITPGALAVFAPGATLRYQAYYFSRQPVVPAVFYSAEWLNYHFSDDTSGATLHHGPGLGVLLSLNALDPGVARDFFESTGVLRTYLALEARLSHVKDPNISVAARRSLYFGFRFEM